MMKHVGFGVCFSFLMGLTGASYASEFTDQDAKNLIYDFSQVATCSYAESPDDFHSVKVVENDNENIGQYGERFAVAWYGDVGCYGGSGSSSWQISFVGIGVGSGAFVDLENPPVGILFFEVSSISLNDSGNIVVEGKRYNPREGSGNQDFVKKTAVFNREGELLESILHIDGEDYPESELDTY